MSQRQSVTFSNRDYILGIASQSLKDQLLRSYGKWIISKGFQDENGEFVVECEDRVSAFVDLVVSNSGEMYNGSDRLFHLNSSKMSHGTLPTFKIFAKDDEIVLVKGVAGIGKSSLLYYLATKWSHECIWNDPSDDTVSNFDFVYIFNFRELNTMTHIGSLEELLTQQYPDVFKHVSFNEIKSVGRKILIILDGADEFGYMDEIFQFQSGAEVKTNISITVYEILNSKRTGLYHNLLVSSRPETVKDLKKVFSQNNVKAKELELRGFNETNIDLYIEKQFHGNEEILSALRRTLKDSANIRAMAAIPFYLSIICILYKDIPGISPPRTVTELYTWALILFVRNHLRRRRNLKYDFNFSKLDVHEIICNYDIQQTLKAVFHLAYTSLCDNRIIFKEEELTDINSELLISTGLLNKFYARGFEVKYQFRHLSMHEFLAAVYIFDKDIKRVEVLRNKRLQGCLSMVAGLEGAYCSDSTNFVKCFVDEFFGKGNKINLTLISELLRDVFSDDEQHINSLFAACLYEYNQEFPTTTLSALPETFQFDYYVCTSKIQLEHFLNLIEKIISCKKDGSSSMLQSSRDVPQEVNQNIFQRCDFRFNYIQLANCDINDRDMEKLCKTIPSIQHVVLSGNKQIGVSGYECLTKAVCESRDLKLEHINLSDCDINDSEMEHLCKTIPSIQHVVLVGNKQIGVSGYECLTKAVCESRDLKLEHINLTDCDINDSEMEHLCKMIPSIQHVVLAGNKQIGVSGYECLIKAVCESRDLKLEHIDLTDCDINDSEMEQLCKMIPLVKKVSIIRQQTNRCFWI